MRYRVTFVVGFGTGYVLGSKAGRTRYEQIVRAFRSVMRTPVIAEATNNIQHEAIDLVDAAKRSVAQKFAGSPVNGHSSLNLP